MDPNTFCTDLTDELDKQICRELTEEFSNNCSAPVDEDAMPFLQDLLTSGVLTARRDRNLPWEGTARKFFVSAAASLGKECDRSAQANGGVVTKPIALSVVKELDPGWRRVCPIQSGDEKAAGVAVTPAAFANCFTGAIFAAHGFRAPAGEQ